MINDTKRNSDKDNAMAIYSDFIIKLINLSDNFARSITEDDSDKLKSIKQFIKRSLSTMKMNPGEVVNSDIEAENDKFIMCLINISYMIAKYNSDFSREMNNYIKKNINDLAISALFRLKFGLHEIIDMPVDKRSKEILILRKRIKKHSEVFFELLIDVMFENKDHEFLKNVVSALLLEDTQMSEKSFTTAQIRDASSSLQEKTFFEQIIQQLTDDEFDEVLYKIHSKFKDVLENPTDRNYFDLMQVTTKFLVMLHAKPNKKSTVLKLIPNKGKEISGRPAAVVEKIINFKD